MTINVGNEGPSQEWYDRLLDRVGEESAIEKLMRERFEQLTDPEFLTPFYKDVARAATPSLAQQLRFARSAGISPAIAQQRFEASQQRGLNQALGAAEQGQLGLIGSQNSLLGMLQSGNHQRAALAQQQYMFDQSLAAQAQYHQQARRKDRGSAIGGLLGTALGLGAAFFPPAVAALPALGVGGSIGALGGAGIGGLFGQAAGSAIYG